MNEIKKKDLLDYYDLRMEFLKKFHHTVIDRYESLVKRIHDNRYRKE